MKKALMFCFALCFVVILSSVPVSAADTTCQTKYPIILAHGMGFTPSSAYPNSFPGIVEALRARGATVYCTVVEPIGATREKAEQFKAELLKIMATDPSAKFNIIGHSHGGLYTRDAITNLGLSPYVASLTTVDSPHRGSTLAGVMSAISSILPWLADVLVGLIPSMDDPEKLTINTQQLSPGYMNNVFNPNTPNVGGVYYQSWSAQYNYINPFITTGNYLVLMAEAIVLLGLDPTSASGSIAALYGALPYLAAEIYLLGGGYNDGLVSVNSAKWGTYLGTQKGYWYTQGVNHLDVVNISPLGATFDVIGYWVKVVKDLKAKGY